MGRIYCRWWNRLTIMNSLQRVLSSMVTNFWSLPSQSSFQKMTTRRKSRRTAVVIFRCIAALQRNHKLNWVQIKLQKRPKAVSNRKRIRRRMRYQLFWSSVKSWGASARYASFISIKSKLKEWTQLSTMWSLSKSVRTNFWLSKSHVTKTWRQYTLTSTSMFKKWNASKTKVRVCKMALRKRCKGSKLWVLLNSKRETISHMKSKTIVGYCRNLLEHLTVPITAAQSISLKPSSLTMQSPTKW